MAEKKEKILLLSPFTLIDTAWQAYLKRVPLFTQIVLPPTLLYLILDTLSYVGEHGVANTTFVHLAQTISHSPALNFPLYIIALVLQTFSTAAMFVVLTDPKVVTVGKAYQEGLRRILSLWWISILTFCIVAGGVFLFLIPGLVFSIWFTFGQYILFKEGKKGMQALLQSREYVRHYFWAVTGRVLFIVLIAGALSSLAGYISILFNNGVLSQIAQGFVSLITVPLAMLYEYHLYENMRAVKGEITIKQKAWWFYLIGLLVPLVVVITLATIVVLLKPITVLDNLMQPTYKNGEKLVMGLFPGVTSTTKNIFYKKDGKILLRKVLASQGEKIQRKGDAIYVVANKGESAMFSHADVYPLSFFTPEFPLEDKKEVVVSPDEVYVMVENKGGANQTWEKIELKQVVGVPLFCYWNCTGKE